MSTATDIRIRNENGGGGSFMIAGTRPLRPSLHWLPLLLLGAACGGTEPEEDEPAEVLELTEEQAVAMFTAVHGLVRDTTAFIVYESESYDSTEWRCPEGGGAWQVGGFELERTDTSIIQTGDFDFAAGGHHVIGKCRVLTDEGEEFAVSGHPAYRDFVQYGLIIGPDSLYSVFAGSIEGAFAWTFEDHSGEYSGECAVDLEGITNSNRQVYTGDLCGFDVEVDLTVEFEVIPRLALGSPLALPAPTPNTESE